MFYPLQDRIFPHDNRKMAIFRRAHERGTTCQIGVFAGNDAFFLVRKGSFSAISHYVFNECRPSTISYGAAFSVVRNRRKWPFLGPKNAPFCRKTPVRNLQKENFSSEGISDSHSLLEFSDKKGSRRGQWPSVSFSPTRMKKTKLLC